MSAKTKKTVSMLALISLKRSIMSSTKTLKANKKKCDSLQQYPLPEKLRLINGFIISQLDWLLAWQNFELKKARKKAYFLGKMINSSSLFQNHGNLILSQNQNIIFVRQVFC